MIPFIRVLGEDPEHKYKTFQYVAAHTIQRVVPLYFVEDDKGDLWISHKERKGAIHVTYRLFGTFDEEYWCNDEKELSKLGVPTSHTKPEIGYICDEESDRKIAIDTTSLGNRDRTVS